MTTSQSWHTGALRQRVRSATIRRMRLRFCALLAALLVYISGCVQPPCCPQAQGRTATTPAPTCGAVYVGNGDPYSSGPLAVRRLSIAACEQGNIVPLLILAPDTPGNYPVAVFQHGFMTRNEAYSEILSHLASHGFVVVAPQMYEPGLAALLGKPTAAEEALTAAQVLSWLRLGSRRPWVTPRQAVASVWPDTPVAGKWPG